MLRHWSPEQQSTKPLVKWKNLLSAQRRGPDPLLSSGRGHACIFPQGADSPIWIPDRLICHVTAPQTSGSPIASTTKEEGHASAPASAAHLEGPADSETTGSGDLGKTKRNHQDVLREQLNKPPYPHRAKLSHSVI